MTDLADARWRRSSFSGSGGAGAGECVELAHVGTGTIAVRDSKAPAGGVLLCPAAALRALLADLIG